VTVTQLDLSEAMFQRDAGMERVLDKPRSLYRLRLEAAIEVVAATGRVFTSDDVRLLAGETPKGESTNLVGALFSAAANSGLIRQEGYRISARVIGHGNLVRAWRGR
jgi:hypothetical protein